MKKLLGKITFECEDSGKIEVKVTQEGDKVSINTDMKLTKSALMPAGDGVQLERSVIFSLFTTMMQAQKEKGE